RRANSRRTLVIVICSSGFGTTTSGRPHSAYARCHRRATRKKRYPLVPGATGTKILRLMLYRLLTQPFRAFSCFCSNLFAAPNKQMKGPSGGGPNLVILSHQ